MRCRQFMSLTKYYKERREARGTFVSFGLAELKHERPVCVASKKRSTTAKKSATRRKRANKERFFRFNIFWIYF